MYGEQIEGTYRKSKPGSFLAIHFFDKNTGKNAIFKKETSEFISGWKLTEAQVKDLSANANVF